MIRDLRDLLHELADHEGHHSTAMAPDPITEAHDLRTRARRRQALRISAITASAAAAVTLGLVINSTLTSPPPPIPALPAPSPTTTRATPSSTPDIAVEPTRGVVAPYPVAPHETWTVDAAALFPDWAEESAPMFGNVNAMSVLPGFLGVDAGHTLVVLVGDVARTRLVGLSSETGEVRWGFDSGTEAMSVRSCAEATSRGSLVCVGNDGTTSAILVIDPMTGTTTRTIPLDLSAESIGVAGDVVIVHGTLWSEGSFRREARDVSTGAILWSHDAPAAEEGDNGGDPQGVTTIVEARAALVGYGYDIDIDVATGVELPPASSGAVSPTDFWIWSGVDDDSLPVFVADTQGVEGSGVPTVALHAVSALDGAALWSYEQPGAFVHGVIDDTVLARSDEVLALLALDTGAPRWSVDGGWPAAFDGNLILTERRNQLDAIDILDGSTVWSISTLDRPATILGNHLVLVGQSTLTMLSR